VGRLHQSLRGQGKKLAQVVRLWASGQLETSHDPTPDQDSDTALAAFGLVADVPEDVPTSTSDKVYLWPCNVRVWGLWQRIQTLWRCGASGREGLDYSGLAVYLRDVARIKPRHFADTFQLIQAMESAALDEWAKQRQNEG
jgi:hypothetical protein